MSNYKHHCQKCGGAWLIPRDVDAKWWRDLARKRIDAFVPDAAILDWLRINTNLTEIDIKQIALHQVHNYGECKSCGENLACEGSVICDCCHSLNYNWTTKDE